MKINLVGPVGENSGYGEFTRQIASGLSACGAEVKIQPILLDSHQKNSQLSELYGRHTKPDVCMVSMVPTKFKELKQPGVKNIGLTMWEANRLPTSWVEACKAMDDIWVPSKYTQQVFADAGIQAKFLPPPIKLADLAELEKPAKSSGQKFSFYSIFQWTERKNPLGLIRAYWAAMTGREDVVLRLKLYMRGQDFANLTWIREQIAQLKTQVRLRHYPSIEILPDQMSREQIINFHLQNDVFVSASRCEGLGLGAIEAIALGNHVIACGYGGHADFLNEQNSDRLSYILVPTMGMGNYAPWYEGDMLWAEANLAQMIAAMRRASHAVPDPELIKWNKKQIVKQYSYGQCSEDMIQALYKLAGVA